MDCVSKIDAEVQVKECDNVQSSAVDALREELATMREENARALEVMRTKYEADLLEMRVRVGWLENKVAKDPRRRIGQSKVNRKAMLRSPLSKEIRIEVDPYVMELLQSPGLLKPLTVPKGGEERKSQPQGEESAKVVVQKCRQKEQPMSGKDVKVGLLSPIEVSKGHQLAQESLCRLDAELQQQMRMLKEELRKPGGSQLAPSVSISRTTFGMDEALIRSLRDQVRSIAESLSGGESGGARSLSEQDALRIHLLDALAKVERLKSENRMLLVQTDAFQRGFHLLDEQLTSSQEEVRRAKEETALAWEWTARVAREEARRVEAQLTEKLGAMSLKARSDAQEEVRKAKEDADRAYAEVANAKEAMEAYRTEVLRMHREMHDLEMRNEELERHFRNASRTKWQIEYQDGQESGRPGDSVRETYWICQETGELVKEVDHIPSGHSQRALNNASWAARFEKEIVIPILTTSKLRGRRKERKVDKERPSKRLRSL
ncbi:hypothetical protein NMY22_g17021 [Coprinellus aureogranulatus]|nr:hypothetical protein NMY22_g17021 [Coprinellus aureogranulatus]